MESFSSALITSLIFFVALLYSSVGHGGASGYLAVLSLFDFAPKEMATTALILNILVSTVAFVSYARAGHFSFALTLPFVLASIPASFIGGLLNVDKHTYSLLLVFVLVFAAIRLGISSPSKEPNKKEAPQLFYSILAGTGIGFLSGVVGIGGGIFLSPLLIIMNWASTKQTSATSAFFILVNSISGLAGHFVKGGITIGSNFIPFLFAACIGGFIGSKLGSSKFSSLTLRRVLAIVLVIAAVKLIFR